jgi:hypothetical protein
MAQPVTLSRAFLASVEGHADECPCQHHFPSRPALPCGGCRADAWFADAWFADACLAEPRICPSWLRWPLQPVWIAGQVVSATFRRPHPVITVAVPAVQALPAALGDAAEFANGLLLRPELAGANVEVEFPPVSLFFDLDGAVGEGDTIAIIALRNCTEPHQLRGQWIRLADGSTRLRSGRMQSGVDGCDAA